MTESTREARRFEDTIPQLANVDVPEALHAWIVDRMEMYPDKKSAIIPCLMAAQKTHGWLSPEAVDQVAAVMKLTPAQHERLVEDASGDSLDAVLCLMQAAWAQQQPTWGLPARIDPLEGWIVGA